MATVVHMEDQPTLGELARDMEENRDSGFTAFCAGFDLAARLAGETGSNYSAAQQAWLWGHYTGRITS